MSERTIYQGGFASWGARLLLLAPPLAAAPQLLLAPNLSFAVKFGALAAVTAVGAASAHWLLRRQVSKIVVGAGQVHLARPQVLSTRWQSVTKSAFRSATYESRGDRSRQLHGLNITLREGDIFVRLTGAAVATEELRKLCPSAFAAYEKATGGGQHSELRR